MARRLSTARSKLQFASTNTVASAPFAPETRITLFLSRRRGTARSNLREPLATELDNLLGEDVRHAKLGILDVTDTAIAGGDSPQ